MNPSFSRSRNAFSLVEVTLALGIAAFCLVSIFGLLPIGVNTNQASFEQTGAANVASAVAADLRAYSSVSPTTTYYQIPVPATPTTTANGFTTFYVRQDGTRSGSLNQNASAAQVPHYRVTLYFTSAGRVGSSTVANPNATAARILVTWPAMADATAATAPSRFSGSFESFAGLNAGN